MTTQIGHWIDGRRDAGHLGSHRAGVQPGDRRADRPRSSWLGRPRSTAAVAAAVAAARAWRHASLSRRAAVLFAFRELLHAHADELAAVVTAEHGKVLADAAGEVARGLENVEFACGVPHLLKGGYSEQASTGVDVYSIRQPLGVVAGITPFNFPVMVPLWMCANAIACGNAFVLKPSEKDPSASLLLAELWQEAGLPDGVFTVAAGRQGGRRRAADPPRRRGGQLRRLHADRPLRLRDRHRARQAGAGARRARRTTWSCCPTPTSTWPPTPRCRPPTARPASGAWRSRSSSRSATSATRWSTPIAARLPKLHGRRRRRPGHRDGPADHRRAPRQGRRLHRRRRAPRAPASSSTARAGRRARATASSSAPRCSTT